MALSRLGSLLLLSSIFLFTSHVHAVDLSEYQVYEADFDSDGDIDYLLKLSPEEVEIPYDINLQIERSAQQYLLENDGAGNFSVALTSSPTGDWQQIDGEVTTINYIDGGLSEIVIKTYGSDPQVIIAGQSSEGALSTGNAIASHALVNGALASIVDLNGDGVEEVIISGDDINTLSASNVSLDHDAVQSFAPKTWAGNDGAAHAAINIFMPKELGPTPNLSLQYSSNAGNGPVGVGFNFTGTSKIHYCRPAADVDGSMAATPFTDEERLCLDGQFLVQTAGASRFEHDATYMTEVSNHSRLRFKSASSKNQFELQVKGGGKLIYAHARKHDLQPTKTIEWYLSRAEDEFGNGYDYTYKYTGHHDYLPLLEKIEYGSITVDLNWEARVGLVDHQDSSKSTGYGDELLFHKDGSTTKLTDRLAGVTVQRNGNALRTYQLFYGVNHNQKSQLEKVKVCALNNACEESIFDWFEGQANFIDAVEISDLTNKETVQKNQFLDVNGDGFTDIMFPSSSGEWIVRLGSATGYGADINTGSSLGSGSFSDFATPIKLGLDHIDGLIVAASAVENVNTGDGANLACVNGDQYFLYETLAQIEADTNVNSLACNQAGIAGFSGKLQYVSQLAWYMIDMEFNGNTHVKTNVTHLINTFGNRLYPVDINKDGHQDIVVKFEYEIVDYQYRKGGLGLGSADGELLTLLLADVEETSSNTSHINFNGFIIKSPQVTDDYDGPLNFVDFNNDGVVDIEKCSQTTASNQCERYYLNIDFEKYAALMACNKGTSTPGCDTSVDEDDVVSTTVHSAQQMVGKVTKTITTEDVVSNTTSNTQLYSPYYYADFDGNGVTDQMAFTTSGMVINHYNDSISSGNISHTTNHSGINGDAFKVRLLDYNSDGLLDVLADDAGEIKLYQALKTQTNPSVEIQYVEKSIFSPSSSSNPDSNAGNTITQFNFINHIQWNNRWFGTGFAGANVSIGNHFADYLDFPNLPIWQPMALQYREAPMVMDYDGDGISDILYFDTNKLYVTQRESDFVNTGKLEKVTDSFGNTTTFTYQESQLEANTDYDDIRFPYVNIANTTGLVASMTSGNDTNGYRTTGYEFIGAQYHLQGRGFMGYGKRIDTDVGNGLKAEQVFEQHFPLIGAVKQTRQYWLNDEGAANLISYNSSTWLVKTLSQFNSQIQYPYPQYQESYSYGLNGIRTGKSSSSKIYDDFGNLMSQTSINYSGNAYTQLASRTSTFEYQHLTESGSEVADEIENWRISFATKQTDAFIAGGKTRTQIREFAPKDQTHLVDNKTELSGDDHERIHNYSYDASGRALSETIASGADALHAIEERTPMTINGFANGYLPNSLTNATDLNASVIYDDIWHQPKSQTSVQGLTQTTQYDNWGTPYKSVSPEGVISLSLTNNCASACPTGAYYSSTQLQMHKSKKGLLAPPQISYFDALGRVLREETKNANNISIYQDYQYDLYGRLTQASLPYTSGTASANIEWVIYNEYDLLDRPLQVSQPNGGVVTNNYLASTIGVALTRQTTNQLPGGPTAIQTAVTKTNALGQVYEVVNNQSGLKNTYVYDGLNNLINADVYEGATVLKSVVATYNNAGLKTQINDPDTGVYNYQYDSLGQMFSQSDARGNSYVFQYDILGQQTQSTLNGNLDATWDYSETVPGLLDKRFKSGFSESYQYDNLHRIKQIDTQLKTLAARQFKFEYDAAGRMQKSHYPSGFSVEAIYNPLGFLTAYQNPKTQQSYWQAQDMDAFGNWVGERMGNGITTQRDYDPASGLLKTITSTKTSNADIQNLAYTWDSNGNLRTRNQGNLTETFNYDGVNRLTSAITTGLTSGTRTLNYDYDALGNMTYKSDLSDVNGMVYGTQTGTGANAGPSRLLNVTKDSALVYSYGYDANGNMTQRGNTNTSFTAANKPQKIWSGIGAAYKENSFAYDTDEQRFYQAQIQGENTVRETFYYGSGYEEVFDTDPQTQIEIHKQKAYVGGVLIHTYTQSDDPAIVGKFADIQYLHHDHLGSTKTVTSASGEVSQSLAFDPFGRARQSNWEDADTNNGNPDWAALALNHTSTGFTGHEMLSDFELIHMGGRLYDPIAGRMMSADPFIQAPLFGQSFNRYAYVWNNPLSATDPSGYETIQFSQHVNSNGDRVSTYDGGSVNISYGISNADQDNTWNSGNDLSSQHSQGNIGGGSGTFQASNSGGYPTWTPPPYNPNANSSGSVTVRPTSGGASSSGSSSSNRPSAPAAPVVPELTKGQKILTKLEGTQASKPWGSYLPGTKAGSASAQYWANRLVSNGGGFLDDPAASVGLAFSVLWTEETAVKTVLTFGTAGLASIGIKATRSGWLRFGPHDKNGGVSIGFGRNNARLDFGKLPNRGKAANRLPEWARGKNLLHYHRRGAGGIGRHRPWQKTPGIPIWKFWERF